MTQPDTFVLFSILYFSDGGECEYMMLHKGTEQECERLASLLPAVSYDGTRPVARSVLRWGPVESNESR